MKKNLLIMMLAFVACFVGAKANELTVADGTDTEKAVPIHGYFTDQAGNYGQMIYPASMLEDMLGKEISELKFYSSTGIQFSGCTVTVKMGTTTQTVFTYSTRVEMPSNAVTASVTPEKNATEISIIFENPFVYEGDNIIIDTEVTTATDNCDDSNGATMYYGQTQSGITSISKKGGSYGTGGTHSFLPKLTFTYTGELEDWAAKVTPATLDFGKVLVGGDATMNVKVKNTGKNAFTPSLSGLAAPFSAEWTPVEVASGETIEIPIKCSPTEEGTLTGSLTVACGEAGEFNVALNGIAKIPGAEVIVCDGTTLDGHAPLYGLYYDTEGCQVQFIYPASMLAELKGRKITSVKFFPENTIGVDGGEFTVSVKEVEQTEFTRDNANAKPDAITEMTLVATIVPNGTDEELLINFSEPFLYNGGNLAFETLVTTSSGWNNKKYYGENQANNCAFYYGNNNSMGMSKFLPKAQFESIAGGEPVVPVESTITYEAEQDNGTITITLADGTPVESGVTKVVEGTKFTVAAAANYGFVVASIEVKQGDDVLTPDADGDGMLKAEGPRNDSQTYTMPAGDVTVNVSFQVKTGIENLNMDNVKSVRYYNLQGVESATPFDGVNIMVREMTDGSKVATKVVK